MSVSPVIIIGMHRSGTSMLAEILQQAGWFGGFLTNRNHEAVFFENLNNWMLREANASWDNPYNFQFITPEFKEVIIRQLERELSSWKRKRFMGWRMAFRYRDIRQLDIPWGWKDPRNTFTLEIWKEIFPDCRIVHIYRNPVDVAESLRRREHAHRETFELNFRRRIKQYLKKGKTGYFISVRAHHLMEGYKLWETYVLEAHRWKAQFGQRMIEIKYEELLEAPGRILPGLFEFCGLNAGTEKIENIARSVNPQRRFGFLQDEELVAFYHAIRQNPVVEQFGYQAII